MNLYCPRCDTTFEEIDPAAFESGLCSTCQGQLSAGRTAVESLEVPGLVAMGFSDDSPIAAPLILQLNNEPVDAGADFEAVTTERTEELARVAAEVAAKKAAAEAAAAAAAEAAAQAAAANPEPSESPALEMPAMPSVDDPPVETGNDAGAPPADGSEATAAKPKDASAVPAGIDMPAFDFSMPALPDFGAPPGGAGADGAQTPSMPMGEMPPPSDPAADAAAAAAAESTPNDPGATPTPPTGMAASPPAPGADAVAAAGAPPAEAPAADGAGLPAHLQLPSFPSFDTNLDPPADAGQSGALPADPGSPEGLPPLPGQDPGNLGPPPLTPPGGMPAHLMPGALPQSPMAPPPEPEPEPQPEAQDDALPALPDLGLPDIPDQDLKREPTLLAQEAASELAQELEKRRSPLPIIIGALVVLAIIGGVAFWQRDFLIEKITGEAPGPVELTAEQKAEAALADGLLVAKAANDLKGGAQKKKLKEAIKLYQQAIEHNPKLAQAHVRLAVAYAKTDDKANAVKHYEAFVDLDPKSKQAKEVQKIIDDYYKAQKEKGEAPKEDPAAKKKKKKKR